MAVLTANRPHAERNTYGLPQGRAIRMALKAWFRDQRKAVARWLKTGRVETKDDSGNNDVSSFPAWDDFRLGDLPMSERMAPLIEAIWDQAGGEFLAKLGLDPDSWDVTNPYTAEAIRKAALAFCQATNATTTQNLADAIDELRTALQEGVVERGESLAWLTRRVAEIFDAAETWRARMIAASEASRAVHAAQERAAIESGVVTGFRWLLSEDACPLCQTVARRCPTVRLGQPFAVIGDNPDYSVIRFPPLHPSCQCTVVEVLDIDEQPEWHETIRDPVPEDQDKPTDEKSAAPLRRKAVLPPPRAMKPRPLSRKAIKC